MQSKIKIYLANPHPDNLTPVYMALYPFKDKIVYVNRNEKFDIMIDNGRAVAVSCRFKNENL